MSNNQNAGGKPEGSSYASAYRPSDSRDAAGFSSQPPTQAYSYSTNQPDTSANQPDTPPPAYTELPGQLNDESQDLGANAIVANDGRVNIRINQRSQRLTQLWAPQIKRQLSAAVKEQEPPPPYIPESLGGAPGQTPPPPLNVVIQIVGSRGDVQPFIALGKVLKETYGHRVRIATHPVFKDFVKENGLEFFSIGGDPAELMAFMVKNPGLMPGFDTLRSGDVGTRRKGIAEILRGTWRSCIEPGNGLDVDPLNQTVEEWTGAEARLPDPLKKPFVADAIIANPPSFGHIHCAEKLGIPLHMMFTMPWSPTKNFPHPLANIQSANVDADIANYMSYILVDMLTWQGLGDVINRFRKDSLSLDPIGMIWAPNMLAKLKIPFTYCWSPALIPKPKDWGQHISVSGFYFLNLASNYTPEPALAEYLAAGEPPVYIGFGSIVVDDPNAMTKMIFEAVKKTGRRALVSKGWGGLGADELGIPEGVFMLGNVPHDWLFKQVAAVVHHGGAGTTAAGISAGRPTVIVPFFGDQPFWGAMTAKAGAGPPPIPYKELTADKLADAIKEALKPESLERAKEMANRISKEDGGQSGAQSFHQMLNYDDFRCMVAPRSPAVWRVRRTQIKLSAKVASILAQENELTFEDLKLYRPREYETDQGPPEPMIGGATAIVGTATQMMMGVADFPIETLKLLNIHPDSVKGKGKAKTTEDAPTNQGSSLTLDNDKQEARIRGSEEKSRHESSNVQSPHTESPARKDEQRSEPGPTFADRLRALNADNAMDTGKGLSRIVGAGFKSPMDFSLNVAKGFHNVPKLMGGEVRQVDRVTDFQSGVKTGAKEFGLGFYEAMTGLVTDPYKGAKKEGAAGFIKGMGRGIFGVPVRVMGGVFSVPGYAMKGLYQEVLKNKGADVHKYIIAARISQGANEAQNMSREEKENILRSWRSLKSSAKFSWKSASEESQGENITTLLKERKEKKAKRQELLAKFRPISRDVLPSYDGSRPASISQSSNGPSTPASAPAPASTSEQQALEQRIAAEEAAEQRELEAAIRASVSETSRGDPDEDEMITQAIRASMQELERPAPADEDEEEALQRALKASVEEAGRRGASEEEQRILEETLRKSLFDSVGVKKERRVHGSDSEWDNSDSDEQDDEDEEYRRVIAESKELADMQARSGAEKTTDGAHEPGSDWDSVPDDFGLSDEAKEVWKRQLEEDEREVQQQGSSSGGGADEDEELKRVMAESQREEQERLAKEKKQKEEEDIVMEYIKKQSLAEEEHRRRLADGRGVGGEGSGGR